MSQGFSSLPATVVVLDLETREPRREPLGEDAFVLAVEGGVPVRLALGRRGLALPEAIQGGEQLTRFELSPREAGYFNSEAAIVLEANHSLLVPAFERFADAAEARSAVARARGSGRQAVAFQRLLGPKEPIGPGAPNPPMERRECPGPPQAHMVTVPVGARVCPDDGAVLGP